MSDPLSRVVKALVFEPPIEILKNDTLELDFARRRAMIVSRVGKVKGHAKFRLEEVSDGESTSTGRGQD